VWLAGQWIRNNNTIRIQRGYYPIMVVSRIAAQPAAPLRLKLTFEESEAFRKWKPMLKDFREPLQEIVRDLPGSEQARTAQAMLGATEDGP
jgi:hypothetical protein